MSDEIMNSGLRFTTGALEHVKKQLQATECGYLRLGVKESGCNGYMYVLDFLEAPAANDHCFNFDLDVNVCVSDNDLSMVDGTEVDMLTQGLNSALVFKNQKATSYCGCGESFAVGEDSTQQPDTASAAGLAVDVGSTPSAS